MSSTPNRFDFTMGHTLETSELDIPMANALELFFKESPYRPETSDIILSHDGLQYVPVSLARARHITYHLIENLYAKGLRPGDSVLLSHLPGTNELFIALLYNALACMGIRAMLPMFMETDDVMTWLELIEAKALIMSSREVTLLNGHEKEKTVAAKLGELLKDSPVDHYDLLDDFPVKQLLHEAFEPIDYLAQPLMQELNVAPGDREILVVTTSGTSGQSKLVAFKEHTFLKCCAIWQKAGSFDIDKVGGKAFTPIFSQILGIRTYFNAVWTGQPICLVNTEWFTEKPETVRYFFMQMLPDHMTGGFSAFNLLLEMVRVFPEVKETVFRHFRTLVSTGAPFNKETQQKIEAATGKRLHNAYGLTETQSVLQTILSNEDQAFDGSLGTSLPGVVLGFERFEEYEDGYKLYIKSPFGMHRILNAKPGELKIDKDGFLDSGDIVRVKNGRIYYVGRENKDFFKDGYGVKIPIPHLRQYYNKLYRFVEHIEYIPIEGDFGLSALIFLKSESNEPSLVTDAKELNFYKGILKEINNHLYKELEPFEFRHRRIRRFALMDGKAPKTAKGTVSSRILQNQYPGLIKELADTYHASRKGVEDLEGQDFEASTFTRRVNPRVGAFLEIMGIDYSYHKAVGNLLYTHHDQQELEILDLAGGYGTNLLGHNHPQIQAAMREFLEAQMVALSDQGSIQQPIGELAELLNQRLSESTGRMFNISFASSGTEAVEMALHHALLEWQAEFKALRERQFYLYAGTHSELVQKVWQHNSEVLKHAPVYIVALQRAYHGNTSGSRAVQGNTKKRETFARLSNVRPVYIDDQGDYEEQLAQALKDCNITLQRLGKQDGEVVAEPFDMSLIAAAMVEPIRGEGGITESNPKCIELLGQMDFPLIMDEIQSGMGRAGSFLASEGIAADYYTFSKALGGNMERIAALAVDKKRYKMEFGELYSSTFANGGLAATVAKRSLEIIATDDIPGRVRERSAKLQERVGQVTSRYPQVFKGVQGRGLMLGLHFQNFLESNYAIMRMLEANELSGYFFAAYLLKNHRVRLYPSLSAPNVLRLEPSAYISDQEIEWLALALEDLANRIQERQTYELFRFMMDGDPFNDTVEVDDDRFNAFTGLEEPLPGTKKVVFISHFVSPAIELCYIDPDFARASATGLRILFNKMQRLLQGKPAIGFSRNIHDGKVHFTNIIIPLDAATMEEFYKKGKKNEIVNKIQEAVNLAAKDGAVSVSLGGYTSILTNNGLTIVEPNGTRVLTGNSTTVAGGIKRLLDSVEAHEAFKGKQHVLGIVGAAGNIGAQITEELLSYPQHFSKVVLIGRKKVKLEQLLNRLREQGGVPENLEVEVVTDMASLKQCDVISVTTNTNDPIVFTHHIGQDRPVLISDLSVPSAVAKEVTALPNVEFLAFSSFVSLPHDPDFRISPTVPKGSVYCCTAEAILWAVEPKEVPLRGKIERPAVLYMKELGEKAGIFDRMGAFKTWKTADGVA